MSSKNLTFIEHLEELRWGIIYALLSVLVFSIVGYFFSGEIIDFLTKPVDKLVFIKPLEAFMTRLKVSVAAGFGVAVPFLLFLIWRFVSPALRPTEGKPLFLGVFFSTLFFLGGISFAHFVVVPIGMKFLLSFATDNLEPMISIGSYLSFVIRMFFAFGFVFQLPIFSYFLTKMGILKPDTLKKNRRIGIIVLIIISALLTPPDIFSQFLMAVPMLLLYEFSIFVSMIAAKPNKKEKTDN